MSPLILCTKRCPPLDAVVCFGLDECRTVLNSMRKQSRFSFVGVCSLLGDKNVDDCDGDGDEIVVVAV